MEAHLATGTERLDASAARFGRRETGVNAVAGERDVRAAAMPVASTGETWVG